MAKKKGKKNQKQADWTSPPPSPKPAVEDAPSLPEALPLSPEVALSESLQETIPPQLPSPPGESVRAEDPISSSDPTTQASVVQQNEEDASHSPEEAPIPQHDETTTAQDSKSEPHTDGTTVEGLNETPSPEPQLEDTPPTSIQVEETAKSPEVLDTAEVSPSQAGDVKETPSVSDKTIDPTPTETLIEPADPLARDPSPEALETSQSEPQTTDSPPGISNESPVTTAPTNAVTVADSPPPDTLESRAEFSETSKHTPAPLEAATTIQAAPLSKADPDPLVSPALPAPPTPPAPPTASEPPNPVSSPTKSGPPEPALTGSSKLESAPPQAVKQVIEDDRPPAPTPPITRARPRHSLALDSDEDEDSALVRPRLRGEVLSRESSRGVTYPPPRGGFASRVPVEHYSNPQPPPPPGYHPRYYPPAAPPYYHNQGHNMSQPGSYPGPSHYGPPSHSSSPYQDSWGQFPPSYPTYGSPQRHDSIGSREFALSPPGHHDSAIEDDSGDVFSRIAQAIPDLHVLLARYKETHGQLGVREELLRRADIEQQERMRAKNEEINALKEKVNNLENRHAGEASRLRLEIGNMEEQMKELREQIAETDKFKKEAEETRLALEAAKASWETKYKALELARDDLEKTAAEDKDKTQKDFEDWKSTSNRKHDAEKIALAIQFDKKLKEADVLAENQRQEAATAFVKEKDELRSEHQRQQRERDSNFDRVRKELETKLTTAQKDREEALKHERESREVWEAERETLSKAHQEDRDSLERGWQEQRELLETQYKKNKEESDKAWIELHADANRKAEEEKAKVEKLSKELEDLRKKFDDLKAENDKEKDIIKSVAGNLESERGRLEKLMECYGDIAEIKSKGDTYYLVSFSQLQKQILDLATTHFVHLPVTPPPDILEKVPPELPSFLGNTTASRQLRAAYVTHTVSAMVTFRMFGPFLFSLGRRYDKADSLFTSMSNHIREKSIRKEAIWRQQTLLAAFTSSGAKQRINTAASTVVDEIVAEIKHFADPKEEEGIKIAVKRIVKLAAETWRFARLEKEMITATMPAVQDEKHAFTGLDFWPSYKAEDTPIASLAGTSAVADERPKLLLRLFPVIHREPKHENFNSSNETPDTGCIYHYGLALYDDAKPVEMRREELRAAGLPPVNSSPTAADFPPPMIPPPRNPPPAPPTPKVGEEEKSAISRPAPPLPSPPPTEPDRNSSVPSVKSAKRDSVRSSTVPSLRSTRQESRRSSPAPSVKSAKDSYVRPVPGAINFSSLTDASPIPSPAESVIAPPASAMSVTVPPLPAPTESIVTSPPAPPIADPPGAMEPPLPAPTESAIIPPFLPPLVPAEEPTRGSSDKDSEGQPCEPPTPPHSRAATPPSPLFAAIDEIEALRPHRSRKPSVSRRSTPSKNSNEELRKEKPDTARRTSGYALSGKSSLDEASLKTDRTEKSERSSSSRYSCESRSAAIKALYPNGPLAGAPPAPVRTNSLRSQKNRTVVSSGTWDTDTTSPSQRSNEANTNPSTHS